LFNLINEPQIFSSTVWFSVHWFQNLLTVFAINANASLSVVSLVFSTAPAIFLYSIFWIVRYGFKQKNSGILLLLLLFGVNQTFFMAVHTPLIFVATLYVILEGIFQIGYRKNYRYENFRLHDKDGNVTIVYWYWALIAVFPFVWPYANVFQDVIMGAHYFSFIGYSLSVAIGTFVIPFLMLAYLVLFLFYKSKNETAETGFGFTYWPFFAISFLLINISRHSRNGLVDVNFELLFFSIIMLIIGFFMIYLWDELKKPGYRFWIVCALVIFAVFGQLRTLPEFQTRQNYVVRLLERAPKTADKLALPEHLQELSRYIDPTFLAFETPLIAGLRRLPMQSIFFIPECERDARFVPRISNHTFNENYFQFSSLDYTILNTPIIPRSLDSLFVSDRIVALGDDQRFGLTVRHKLQRGDSLSLSVWRKGSDFGHLVVSDDRNQNLTFWLEEQLVSEPNSANWQKLSTSFVAPQTQSFRFFVYNRNYKKERMYFKNFRIEIWRE